MEDTTKCQKCGRNKAYASKQCECEFTSSSDSYVPPVIESISYSDTAPSYDSSSDSSSSSDLSFGGGEGGGAGSGELLNV